MIVPLEKNVDKSFLNDAELDNNKVKVDKISTYFVETRTLKLNTLQTV